MFEPQNKEEIAKRIKETLKSDLKNATSIIEGTFCSDMAEANALEFSKAYMELSMAIDAGFAHTSWGEYLTMRAAEYGVLRKQASKAHGILTITGTPSSRIIKNSLFATLDDTKFYTAKDSVIGTEGAVDCDVFAEIEGVNGNVAAEMIAKIPMSIPGVMSVVNRDKTKDGFNEESDAALLERYLLKVRTPATSGNKYHYLNWARECVGVGNAKVFPLWAGNGTVKVVIVDANNQTASEALIQSVYEHIEEERPIGATVTVTTALPKLISISASIIGTADKEEFRKKINNEFTSGGLEITYISIAKVGKILLECSGIADYDELKLNGQMENISLEIEELPTLGEVNFSNVS